MVGCKLNRLAVQYLIDNGTTTEISLMLYLSKISNEFGSIQNLDIKDIANKLLCTRQSIYNALEKLSKNNILLLEYRLTCINCTINNNIFLQKNYKEGYINTNIDFLYNEEFIKAKLNVKKVVLMFLSAFKNKKDEYIVNFNTLAQRLGEIVRRSLVWDYIDKLKTWFDIKEDKKLNFSFKLQHIATKAKEFTKDILLERKLKNFLEKYKIDSTIQDIKDTITLMKVYGFKNKHRAYNKLLGTIIDTCINHKKLIPPLINATLKFRMKEVTNT